MRSVQTANRNETQGVSTCVLGLVLNAPAYDLSCACPAPGVFGPFSAVTMYEKELPALSCWGPLVARST